MVITILFNECCTLKVLMPFWDMRIISRYLPQLESIAKKVDELIVVYDSRKEAPKSKWIRFEEIPYGNRWLKPLEYIKKVDEFEPDVLYTLSGLIMEMATFYSGMKRKIPIVMRLRGNDIRQRRETRGLPTAYLYKLMYKFMWSKYNLIIPISHRLGDIWKSKYGLNNITEPVYNGFDKDVFYPIDNEVKDFTCCYVGRISQEKGGYLLEKLFKETPEIKYIVAGTNQLGIELPNNVTYYDWLSLDDVNKLVYNKAHYTLLPSFYEGVPNIILESYLTNTDVIVSGMAIPYDIKVDGYVVGLKTSKWINIIKQLSKEGIINNKINSRDYVVNNFSWERYGKEMVNHLESVVDV